MKNFIKDLDPRVLLMLSGALLGLSVTFAEIGLLAYAALIPLAIAVYKRVESGAYTRCKRAYRDGFCFFMTYGLVIFHWFIYFYPLEFTGMGKPAAMAVVILAWIGVPLLQAVFSSLLFALIPQFIKTRVYKKHKMLLSVFIAVIFVINEWTQTLTWAGVPWGRIGISQAEMPLLLQTASLFGSYFITFVIVLLNCLVAFAVFYRKETKMALISASALALSFVLCSAVLFFIPTKNENKYIKVAAVQGNLLSQENYDMSISDIFEIYDKLSVSAAEEGAELIIWPENVFGTYIDALFRYDTKFITLQEAVSALAADTDATFVVGSYTFGEDGGLYNSVSAFYPNGESEVDAYSKIKIVPFGEFVPMKELVEAVFPMLADISMLPADGVPGKECTVFDSSADESSINIGTLICFDSIYDEIGIDSAKAGAELFVVPSNDSWFYNSRALNMHHSQNILRAVEQSKYTVSAGNTGITSIVSDKGEIIARMDIYEEGYLVETVYANGTRTLYSYIGNAFVYLCIALAVLAFVSDAVTKYRKSKKTE